MREQQINYYFKTNWKEIFFFIILWLLLYIEPVKIGSLKISQIWKAGVVVGMFGYLFVKHLPVYVWIGFLFSFKYLIYIKVPYGFLTAIQNALESMIFPLFLGFFYIKYKNRSDSFERLSNIAISLSLFLIFSTVPFMFGLETLNPVTELDKYGIEGTATKGLFYHVAVSSKIFSIATIVLINSYDRFSNNFKNKIIWIFAILLGIWFVFSSWTRTGWFIFLIVILVSLFYNSSSRKKIISVILSFFIFISIFWMYDNNQAFHFRLTGGSVYRQDTELSVEQLSSARLPFIIVALDNLKEEGLLGQSLGYGTQHSIDLFEKKTGMSIVSHNATFNILESSGILGLLLFWIFIFLIYIRIKRYWKFLDDKFQKNILVLFFLFIGFYLTSHGTPFWGEIIYSCYIIAALSNKKISEHATKNSFNRDLQLR
ncbi:O-antigen ligase family protein [Algoriphagus marinus]|uniref:O-antigen ligase family protein n=1 Tax=Algoriphagus marinus TaxID=1925762 RepID=UPI00094B997A|nr:O-antigen ligase family protein [Algoriphagus marinus]